MRYWNAVCWLMLIALVASESASAGPKDRRSINQALGIGTFFADQKNDFKDTEPAKTKTPAKKAPVQESEQRQSKSALKAGLLSALLPGAGEYYLGNHGKARYFFTVEAVSWVSVVAFRVYGHYKKDDYIRLAATSANAQLKGKSDDFLDLVGFYRDIDEYNSLGRVWDTNRPYLYDTPENHWRWQSDADQQAYRSLKNSSREAYRRAKFMIAVTVANRIVSIADAVRDAKRMHRKLDPSFSQEDRIQIHFDTFSDGAQVTLALRTPF